MSNLCKEVVIKSMLMNFKNYFVLHEKKTKLNDAFKKTLKTYIRENDLGQDKLSFKVERASMSL